MINILVVEGYLCPLRRLDENGAYDEWTEHAIRFVELKYFHGMASPTGKIEKGDSLDIFLHDLACRAPGTGLAPRLASEIYGLAATMVPGGADRMVKGRMQAGHIRPYLPEVLWGLRQRELADTAMLMMALATIRAETSQFEPVDEGISKYNTTSAGRKGRHARFRLSVPARFLCAVLLLSATACAFQLKQPVKAALGKDDCEATINAERSKRRQSDEPRELGPVQLCEDGHFVVAALNDGVLSRLLAFNAKTGRLRWDKPLDAPAVALAANAVNDEVAVAFRSRPCKARQNPHNERWRLQTGVATIPALEDAGELSSLRADSAAATVYTGDGKSLVAALRNAVRVWDVSSGKNRLAIQPPGFDKPSGVERVTDIAASQDARIIAGAGETSVLLWDGVSGGALAANGEFPERIHSVRTP